MNTLRWLVLCVILFYSLPLSKAGCGNYTAPDGSVYNLDPLTSANDYQASGTDASKTFFWNYCKNIDTSKSLPSICNTDALVVRTTAGACTRIGHGIPKLAMHPGGPRQGVNLTLVDLSGSSDCYSSFILSCNQTTEHSIVKITELDGCQYLFKINSKYACPTKRVATKPVGISTTGSSITGSSITDSTITDSTITGSIITGSSITGSSITGSSITGNSTANSTHVASITSGSGTGTGGTTGGSSTGGGGTAVIWLPAVNLAFGDVYKEYLWPDVNSAFARYQEILATNPTWNAATYNANVQTLNVKTLVGSTPQRWPDKTVTSWIAGPTTKPN